MRQIYPEYWTQFFYSNYTCNVVGMATLLSLASLPTMAKRGYNFTNHSHADENYQYNQNELQSKYSGYIIPNPQNKADTIICSEVVDIYDKVVLNPDTTHG